MSDEITVSVEGVSKKYCKDLKRSLRYGLQDLADELLLKRNPSTTLRKKEFWALTDVNFELKRGEAFGIIGVNGSGKTTLLKLLHGLLKPTQGKITLRGRVGALITLGAGFQPLLTGRENIYTNAAILGIPKRDVDHKLEEILDFADIGDFIDAPVKTYSSGMKGRLGFSVAVNLVEPDVLLLDEVLATGDWRFKDKCFQRMEEIVSSGATIVFVSHLVPKVEQLCHRALLLHKGVTKAIGPAVEVCEQFYELPDNELPPRMKRRKRRLANRAKPKATVHHEESESFDVIGIELLNTIGISQDQFCTLETLIIRIRFVAHRRIQTLKSVVQLLTVGDQICISSFESSFHQADAYSGLQGESYIDCIIPELLLRQGRHKVHVTLTESSPDGDTLLFKSDNAAALTVISSHDVTAPKTTRGLIYMPSSWRSSHERQPEPTP
ncbi:MAG: ABC transporter ATP-binding protein [Elainellaceae cyanobacterium]